MESTCSDNLVAFGVTDESPDIRYLVSLSDGRTIIQDDRKESEPSWKRLRRWLELNPSISITNIRIQNAKLGIEKTMPPKQKGYFYGKRHGAVWGGPQFSSVGIGYYDGTKVNLVWYSEPDFSTAQTEERTKEKAGIFLIEN